MSFTGDKEVHPELDDPEGKEALTGALLDYFRLRFRNLRGKRRDPLILPLD